MFESNHSGKKKDLERLQAMLREDAAARDKGLAQLAAQLKKWEAPEADAAATAQLIARLGQEMPAKAKRQSLVGSIWNCWPVLLMRSQTRVVRREIWAASALVMALGTIVALVTYNQTPQGASPIAILAPVVAAIGVALLYDNEVEQMLELENATPASSRILLLARLTLVFGFDLVLGICASAVLATIHSEVLLWPLVMSWLAPMTFLSALAFLLSIVSRDVILGTLVGMILWGAHVLIQSAPMDNPLVYFLSLPGLSAPESRPLLLLVAVGLVVLALWFVGYDERRTGDAR